MRGKYIETVKWNVCCILLQMIAIVALFSDWRIGAGLISLDILIMIAGTIVLIRKKGSVTVCSKCGAEIPKKVRVCPVCGMVIQKENTEKELAEVIKQESESVEAPSPLDRDFERIEEMDVDKALSYGSEDIESILVEKMRKDDTVL